MVDLRSDIPIPGTGRKRRAANYPWRTMEVGQSFYVPNQRSAISGCFQMAARYGRKFTWREEVADLYGERHVGARVWRTA